MEVSTLQREQTTIRIPVDLKEKLQKEAQEKGISLNAYILMLVEKNRHGG